MANNINKTIIIGNLTRDPEIKSIPSGFTIANFSIAVNRKFADKEEVSYFDCQAWGKLAEKVIAEYCKKGSMVALDGRIKQERWQDKETGKDRSKVIIVVEGLQLLGGKPSE